MSDRKQTPNPPIAPTGREIVPKDIQQLAELYEAGYVVIGGRRYGRTWAQRIAMAHLKALSPNH